MKKILLTALLLFATNIYGKEIHVDIVNFTFEPATVEAVLGDVIIFTNKDTRAPHSVVPASDSPVQFDGSGILRLDDSFSLELTEATKADQDMQVRCGVHPSMPGLSISVLASEAHRTIKKIELLLAQLKMEI